MIYRYPARALAADYLRAAAGLAFSVGPLLAFDLPVAAQAVFLPVAGLFVLFTVQAAGRGRLRIAVTEDGLERWPGARRMPWGSVTGVKLAYFSVRRDGGEGWMELKLRAAGSTLRADSRLTGFADLVRRVFQAAREAGVEIDATSAGNLAALDAAPHAAATYGGRV